MCQHIFCIFSGLRAHSRKSLHNHRVRQLIDIPGLYGKVFTSSAPARSRTAHTASAPLPRRIPPAILVSKNRSARRVQFWCKYRCQPKREFSFQKLISETAPRWHRGFGADYADKKARPARSRTAASILRRPAHARTIAGHTRKIPAESMQTAIHDTEKVPVFCTSEKKHYCGRYRQSNKRGNRSGNIGITRAAINHHDNKLAGCLTLPIRDTVFNLFPFGTEKK